MTLNRRQRERNLRSHGHLRHLPLMPVHRQVGLQWCRVQLTRTLTAEGIVFSDEFRFQLCPDENSIRVWRRPTQ